MQHTHETHTPTPTHTPLHRSGVFWLYFLFRWADTYAIKRRETIYTQTETQRWGGEEG